MPKTRERERLHEMEETPTTIAVKSLRLGTGTCLLRRVGEVWQQIRVASAYEYDVIYGTRSCFLRHVKMKLSTLRPQRARQLI